MFWFLPSCQELKNSLGVLGENLGLAGMVLLLDRRDKKRFLFFCYVSRQTCVEVKGSLTLREVLMKRHNVLKEVSRLRARDKGD